MAQLAKEYNEKSDLYLVPNEPAPGGVDFAAIFPDSEQAAAAAGALQCARTPRELYDRIAESPKALAMWGEYFSRLPHVEGVDPLRALAVACYYMSGGQTWPAPMLARLTRALKTAQDIRDLFHGSHRCELDFFGEKLARKGLIDHRLDHARRRLVAVPTLYLCAAFANILEKCK